MEHSRQESVRGQVPTWELPRRSGETPSPHQALVDMCVPGSGQAFAWALLATWEGLAPFPQPHRPLLHPGHRCLSSTYSVSDTLPGTQDPLQSSGGEQCTSRIPVLSSPLQPSFPSPPPPLWSKVPPPPWSPSSPLGPHSPFSTQQPEGSHHTLLVTLQ